MRKLEVYAMSNLDQDSTGIAKVVVWVSDRGHTKHACRIKVSNICSKLSRDDTFSMRVPDGEVVAGEVKLPQTVLVKLKKWILLNQKTLLEYWNYEISTKKMLEAIRKI